MKYLPLLLMALAAPVQAEPGNAPDTKGHFVLVVGGTVHQSLPRGAWNPDATETSLVQIQPFTIPGFTSFKLCVGAGKELQARLNTDGYALDFACIATGR